jgi:hypothetical protein
LPARPQNVIRYSAEATPVPTKADRYRKLYGRRRDDLLSILLPVADAYDTAQHSGEFTPECASVIANAACHPRLLVAMNASELLQSLSNRWPELIAQAVFKLFGNPNANARFAAICSLTKSMPQDVLTEILRNGLKDRSARVRWKAADRIDHLEQKGLLLDLTAATSVEKNAKTCRTMEHHLKMLRDGYVADKEVDDEVYLWIRTPKGTSGRQVPTDVIKKNGIEAVIQDLKASSPPVAE